MKAAIIGYGNIAPYYASALKKRADEIFICSRSKPKKYDKDFLYIPHYKCRELQAVDLIIIATPPNVHLEMANFFTEMHKKVILEKPAVISKEEVITLKQLKYKNNLYLAYHSAFNPLVQNIKKIVDVSMLKKIEVNYQENVFYYHPGKNDWLFDQKQSGGGCLIDSGINIFSILYQFTSELFFLNGQLKNRKLPVEDFLKINLRSKNNVDVAIKIDWLSSNENREFTFITDKKIIKMNLANNSITVNGDVKFMSKEINKIDMFAEYNNLLNDSLNYFKTNETILNFPSIQPLETVFNIYNKLNKYE